MFCNFPWFKCEVCILDWGNFKTPEMCKTLISAEYSNSQLLMVLVTCTAQQISFGDKIKEEDMRGACVERTQEKKNSFKILEEQPERNRPLGRNRSRWNNIKNNSQRNRTGGG